jgi:predicted metal-dependent HD superfamily phosphohydrolase
LCDADLAILGSDPSEYANYVAGVREEYAQLPDEEFLAGRLAVLSELADREIFRTAKGRQLTDAARANLAAEIAAVTERLGIAVEGSDV